MKIFLLRYRGKTCHRMVLLLSLTFMACLVGWFSHLELQEQESVAMIPSIGSPISSLSCNMNTAALSRTIGSAQEKVVVGIALEERQEPAIKRGRFVELYQEIDQGYEPLLDRVRDKVTSGQAETDRFASIQTEQDV